MKTRVTVIVPVYNVAKYIERCIQSVLEQDYNNIELIVVNDGSTDESLSVVKKILVDDKITYTIVDKKNGGLSSARNAGLELATGGYIFFLDSDDYIEKNTISAMVDAAEKNNIDIVVCGRYDEYENRMIKTFCLDKQELYDCESALKNILTWKKLDIAACDKLYRSSLWHDMRFPEGKNNEDIQIIPTIILKSNGLLHVGNPLYHYCHRDNSITTSYNEKKIKDFFEAIISMDNFIQLNYPSIHDELIYYKNQSFLNLMKIIEVINYEGKEKKDSLDYLKKNWSNTFSLEVISRHDKIVYYLIRLHLFHYAYKIITKMRSIAAR